MAIELRPHQIPQVAAAINNGLQIVNVYGQEVQTTLNDITKEIRSNPDTEIKIVGSNGTLCVDGCMVRPDTYDFCAGIDTESFENEIATRLGVKIGQTYKAKDIRVIRTR